MNRRSFLQTSAATAVVAASGAGTAMPARPQLSASSVPAPPVEVRMATRSPRWISK